jgi:hypothetical protein
MAKLHGSLLLDLVLAGTFLEGDLAELVRLKMNSEDMAIRTLI